MINAPFDQVAKVYEQLYKTRIVRHRLEHQSLGYFCIALDKLDKKLGELSNDEYWRRFLRPLKRLRFSLIAAPSGIEYRQERMRNAIDNATQLLPICQKLYPHFAEAALNILELLNPLLDEFSDPLFQKLVELTPYHEQVAWVVKESGLIPSVEDSINNMKLPLLTVIHPLQLKDVMCYERLVVIGPSRWFPESVFTASRSDQIHIVVFDWINDRWQPQKVFARPHSSSNRKGLEFEERETNNRWAGLNAESLLTVVNNAASVRTAIATQDQEEFEDVEAVCVFLEDDQVLFIDSSEDAKTLVIDLDEEPENRITRIPVKNIQPGTFILVRAGGGGDYIVPVADKIMGEFAKTAREYQSRWKDLLRAYAKTHGLLKTSIDLIDVGSKIAVEANVRNWMSPRSIRTQNFEDFSAIMKLVGLGAEATNYWAIMERIDRAHRKAGHEIRDLLLDQVRDLDSEVLQKHGKMDFKLASDDEGGISAFRVENVLEESIKIPYSRIGQPFKLD